VGKPRITASTSRARVRYGSTMRILGVDPGLVNTGYAVIEQTGGRLQAVEGGVITTKSADPLPERLHTIFGDIREVIARLRPDAMAIEDLHSRAAFVKTAILMGHARGVVVMAAGEAGVPVFDYQPARAKNIVTGSGRADKDQIRAALAAHLGSPDIARNEHVADAFSIALCHALISDSPAWAAARNATAAGKTK